MTRGGGENARPDRVSQWIAVIGLVSGIYASYVLTDNRRDADEMKDLTESVSGVRERIRAVEVRVDGLERRETR